MFETPNLQLGKRLRPLSRRSAIGLANLMLFILLASGAAGSASGSAPTGTYVVVLNQSGSPITGAYVYQCQSLTSCTYRGQTNLQGRLYLSSVQVRDILVARASVGIGGTSKGSHNGLGWRIFITNILQNNDGTQSAFTVVDPTDLQYINLLPSNAQVGFNIVASVEYNATYANLQDIASGLGYASAYLFDVTDGQMYFDSITVYEDKQNWGDADFQYYATVWPSSPLGGGPWRVASNAPGDNIWVPGPGFEGNWVQPNGFRTLIHEFTHYALGALDEYFKYDGNGQGVGSTCTLDRASQPIAVRASIMDDQRSATEYCNDANHNPDTAQGQVEGRSVWGTFLANWGGSPYWALRTPMSRGVADPGPAYLPYIAWSTYNINQSNVAECPPLPVTVTISGTPVPVAHVGLRHNGYGINQGNTNNSGQLMLYGAVPGDLVTANKFYSLSNRYYGSAQVGSCSALTIPLSPTNPQRGYFLSPDLDPASRALSIVVNAPAGSITPTLYVEQSGGNHQQVSLNYDNQRHVYTGTYQLVPSDQMIFDMELSAHSGQPEIGHAVYHYVGAQFHTSGPPTGPNINGQIVRPLTPPSTWELFPSENLVGIGVHTTSVPDGTGILVGQSDVPASPPSGLQLIAGPFSVQGQHPISGTVHLSIPYQVENFCGLLENSIKIYRYDEGSSQWVDLLTVINSGQKQAYSSISAYGIYAIFAQPVPQPTFSDVPPGSPFYTYVSWVACHGIATGYNNGTFGVNNNATRGQISKMVVLAFRWYHEPPATATFADVALGSPFFEYVETAYTFGVFSGYACGGDGEPCDPQSRPYFRPANLATRGQIAKILSNSAHFDDTHTEQSFEDVAPGSTFHQFVERMASRGIIGGYSCGGPDEPCVPPANRPYFRSANNATRGQLSKMIYLTLEPR